MTAATVAATGGNREIRVAVAGYRGKDGQEVERAVEAAPDLLYVGGIGRGDPLEGFLSDRRPRVVVDFTHPSVALSNALAYVRSGASPVIGTSGWNDDALGQLERACQAAGLGGIVAPNFAVGAVLMIWLAEKAAPFFDAVEVIEMHAATKVDAPSGTALATARSLAGRVGGSVPPAEKLLLEDARGGQVDGVHVHSVRLPGLVADQEIVFGLAGQTLTIAHRTTSREAFTPGVLLAVRRVVQEATFYRGLGPLLGLD